MTVSIPWFRAVEALTGAAFLIAFWVPLLVQRRFQVRWVLCVAITIYVVILLRTAYLCDDAFITFRTVDHFIRGKGLVFNIGERVQTFTSPAWMFLLSLFYAATRELPYTTIILSIVISAFSVGILAFRSSNTWQAGLMAVFALTASKSFIDSSTSGLENPLTFLFVALFLMLYFGRDRGSRNLFLLSLIACLATFNRMDTIMLFMPALIWEGLHRPNLIRSLFTVVAGFSLFFAWELFSLGYYGFLFPNTAYAKLNTGIPESELFMQGLFYFRNSLMTDPLTLSLIAVTGATALFGTTRPHAPIVIGILIYLAYLLKIGGCFIAGRFFAAPFFASVWIMARMRPFQETSSLLPAAAVITVGALLVSPMPNFFSGPRYGAPFSTIGQISLPSPWLHESGIEDSRYFYYPHTSFGRLTPLTGRPTARRLLKKAEWYKQLSEERGKLIVVEDGIGILGTLVGDKVHILDPVAIADPLLARLPARRDIAWRIGHFERAIPDGYVETIESGQNHIRNRNIATYYDKLSLIVRGKLFNLPRMLEIYRFNLGLNEYLIDNDYFVDPPTTGRVKRGPVLQMLYSP